MSVGLAERTEAELDQLAISGVRERFGVGLVMVMVMMAGLCTCREPVGGRVNINNFAHSFEGVSGRALRRRRGLESMPVILLLIFCTRPVSVAGDDAAAPLPLAPCGSLSGVDDPLLPPPKLFRSLFFLPAVDDEDEEEDGDDDDSAAGAGESAVGGW